MTMLSATENVKKMNLHHFWWECKMVQPLWKRVRPFSYTRKYDMTLQLCFWPLSRRNENYAHKNIPCREVWLVTAPRGKKPRCPSTGGCLNKRRSVRAMRGWPAIKRNRGLPFSYSPHSRKFVPFYQPLTISPGSHFPTLYFYEFDFLFYFILCFPFIFCNYYYFNGYFSNTIDFFFFLFRAAPLAYGGSQARGRTGAIGHRHSHARSQPRLRPTPQLTAMPDPSPTE